MEAKRNLLPLQPDDVPDADADIKNLEQDFGFKPSMPIKVEIPYFVDWYCSYYRI